MELYKEKIRSKGVQNSLIHFLILTVETEEEIGKISMSKLYCLIFHHKYSKIVDGQIELTQSKFRILRNNIHQGDKLKYTYE